MSINDEGKIVSNMTYNILRNIYANSEYRGRRARVARRLRDIQGHINNARIDAREEKLFARDDAAGMLMERYSIPDVQGTLIFVVTEKMRDDVEKGIWSEDIRALGRDTYIALGSTLLARAFDA